MAKKRYFVLDIDGYEPVSVHENPNHFCADEGMDEGCEFYEIQVVKKYKVKSSKVVYKVEEVK